MTNKKKEATSFDKIDVVQLRVDTERTLIKMVINEPHITERMQNVSFENIRYKKFFDRIDAMYQKGDYQLSNSIIESFLAPICSENADDNKDLKELCSPLEFTEDELKFNLVVLSELVAKRKLGVYVAELQRRMNTNEDLKQILNIGEKITSLANDLDAGETNSVSAGFALSQLTQRIREGFETGETQDNIQIPIDVLADVLYSFAPNDLVVVAARPSVGKTAFGVNFCYNSPLPSGFISSEMTSEQLVGRLVSCATGIDSKLIRNPNLMTDDEYQLYTQGAKKVMEVCGDSLYIDDTGNIKIDQIERDVDEWVKVHGVRFIVVDYAQRIDSDRKHDSRAEAIGHVTKRLKSLAKKYGICVILLAQINRDGSKDGVRPQIHHIKDCGEIEQEADIILLLHKPVMGTSAQNQPHVIEIIIGKNRNGIVGTVISEFDPNFMSYSRPLASQIALAQNHYKVDKSA
ncbi:DnaB-like helicase C-terminal domain-containing protein [Photobacterium damselae]|uniref:DnaB-like helicase C-terminal domain-containing protein n=1 Tax=Photobacterium damselae TaxID=38293 RepID=UPI00406852F9